MFCASSDHPVGLNGLPSPHSRIVRIPPGESVVLNSAERAPFVLIVEVLSNDLDFDPKKITNKEVLKRMLSSRESKDASVFASSSKTAVFPSVQSPDTISQLEDEEALHELILKKEATEDEEIDLVEQLYGNNEDLRQPIDISASIVQPIQRKNKELEIAAWSRISVGAPPGSDQSHVRAYSYPIDPARRMSPHPRLSTTETNEIDQDTVPYLSLDEYSQRMRTAAVMLAQLNANVVREVVLPFAGARLDLNSSAHLSGAVPGNWTSDQSWPGDKQSAAGTGGPIHPSLTGTQSATSSTAPITRMKVSHAEAAAIRTRIMKEMLSLEEERMERMKETREDEMSLGETVINSKNAEDEGIIRRELSKADPSAVVFSESWEAKKVRT